MVLRRRVHGCTMRRRRGVMSVFTICLMRSQLEEPWVCGLILTSSLHNVGAELHLSSHLNLDGHLKTAVSLLLGVVVLRM